jgi:hypothetical protein
MGCWYLPNSTTLKQELFKLLRGHALTTCRIIFVISDEYIHVINHTYTTRFGCIGMKNQGA